MVRLVSYRSSRARLSDFAGSAVYGQRAGGVGATLLQRRPPVGVRSFRAARFPVR